MCLPLFIYMVVIGCHRTTSKVKYFFRLVAFGFLSQLPYVYFFESIQLNILFSLSYLVVVLSVIKHHWFLGVLLILFAAFCDSMQVTAYPLLYVLLIGICFNATRNPYLQGVLILLLSLAFYPWPSIQFFSVFAVIVIAMVPDTRLINGGLFYWFYPAHFAALVLIRDVFHNYNYLFKN